MSRAAARGPPGPARWELERPPLLLLPLHVVPGHQGISRRRRRRPCWRRKSRRAEGGGGAAGEPKSPSLGWAQHARPPARPLRCRPADRPGPARPGPPRPAYGARRLHAGAGAGAASPPAAAQKRELRTRGGASTRQSRLQGRRASRDRLTALRGERGGAYGDGRAELPRHGTARPESQTGGGATGASEPMGAPVPLPQLPLPLWDLTRSGTRGRRRRRKRARRGNVAPLSRRPERASERAGRQAGSPPTFLGCTV